MADPIRTISKDTSSHAGNIQSAEPNKSQAGLLSDCSPLLTGKESHSNELDNTSGTAENQSLDKIVRQKKSTGDIKYQNFKKEFYELKLRMLEKEKAAKEIYNIMLQDTLTDVRMFESRVQADGVSVPFYQDIMKYCSRFIQELQSKMKCISKEIVTLQKTIEDKKSKCRDLHETMVASRGDIYTTVSSSSATVPENVKSLQEKKETDEATNQVCDTTSSEHDNTENETFSSFVFVEENMNSMLTDDANQARSENKIDNAQRQTAASEHIEAFNTTNQPPADVVVPTISQQPSCGVSPSNFPGNSPSSTQNTDIIFPQHPETNAQQAPGDMNNAFLTTTQPEASKACDPDALSLNQSPKETHKATLSINQVPMAKIDLSSVDLLLIGNSGNGKSATGNSILNSAAFKRSAASTVACAGSTSSIAAASTQIRDKTVNVIDGPSIDDCGKIQPEDLDKIIDAVEKSMELCNFGFTALLIVLKFGNRFTKQEAEAIRVIKFVLGRHVVRDYGVCIITHGDNFDNAVEEAAEDNEILTFESWLKDQTGEVKNLFEECNYRCVLFDNMTKDDKKKKDQVEKLLSVLPPGKRYSKEEFLQSEEGQQELSMEANLPQFLKQMQTEIEKIREKINKIEREKGDNVNEYILNMALLASELHEQKEKIQKMGLNTPAVEGMKLLVSSLEMEINLKVKQFEADTAIKKYAENQDNSMGASKSGYKSPLECQPAAITELEAMSFIHSFEAILQNYEKILDVHPNKSLLNPLSESLQSFTETVKRVDPFHKWVPVVLAKIERLRCTIDSTNQTIPATTHSSNRNEEDFHLVSERDRGGRSWAPGHVFSPTYDKKILVHDERASHPSRLDVIRRRVHQWYKASKAYISNIW